jgi:hypothetical protein
MSGGVRNTSRWTDPRYVVLLLLALAPGVSTSRTPGDSDRSASENATESLAEHDGIRGSSCRDLRDAELILARHEVQLLDELASESARSDEREARRGELDETRASLDDVDRSLAAARCPPVSTGR